MKKLRNLIKDDFYDFDYEFMDLIVKYGILTFITVITSIFVHIIVFTYFDGWYRYYLLCSDMLINQICLLFMGKKYSKYYFKICRFHFYLRDKFCFTKVKFMNSNSNSRNMEIEI